MNSVAKEIKDYWMRQSASFSWDAETLDLVSKSLNPEEVEKYNHNIGLCYYRIFNKFNTNDIYDLFILYDG